MTVCINCPAAIDVAYVIHRISADSFSPAGKEKDAKAGASGAAGAAAAVDKKKAADKEAAKKEGGA